MQVRLFEKEDYETVCEWWDQWGVARIPFEFLPPTGFIVDRTCAVFVYKTDSPICWIEHYISSKSVTEGRSEAINLMIEFTMKFVKAQGFSVVMSSIKHEGLKKRLKSLGFIESDTGMTNFVGVL